MCRFAERTFAFAFNQEYICRILEIQLKIHVYSLKNLHAYVLSLFKKISNLMF